MIPFTFVPLVLAEKHACAVRVCVWRCLVQAVLFSVFVAPRKMAVCVESAAIFQKRYGSYSHGFGVAVRPMSAQVFFSWI